MGLLKSPGTPFRTCSQGVLAVSGTTTCEHSQELTPVLLELKVTSVFMASMLFMTRNVKTVFLTKPVVVL